MPRSPIRGWTCSPAPRPTSGEYEPVRRRALGMDMVPARCLDIHPSRHPGMSTPNRARTHRRTCPRLSRATDILPSSPVLPAKNEHVPTLPTPTAGHAPRLTRAMDILPNSPVLPAKNEHVPPGIRGHQRPNSGHTQSSGKLADGPSCGVILLNSPRTGR